MTLMSPPIPTGDCCGRPQSPDADGRRFTVDVQEALGLLGGFSVPSRIRGPNRAGRSHLRPLPHIHVKAALLLEALAHSPLVNAKDK